MVLTGGCGYRFSQGGESIAPDIRRVYVDTFRNDTGEAYVESYLRNGFIDQFRRSNRFRITDGKETADAVLTGGIKTIVVTPLAREEWSLAARQLTRRGLRVVTILVNPASFYGRQSAEPLYQLLRAGGQVAYLVNNGDDLTTALSRGATEAGYFTV